jgi:hypothetical protein
MPIREPPAALHHPTLGPIDQLWIQFVLIAEGEIDALLRLLPDHAKTLLDIEPMPNALRHGATKAFAKNFLFIRYRKEIHRRGKLASCSLKRVSHGEADWTRQNFSQRFCQRTYPRFLARYSHAKKIIDAAKFEDSYGASL